MSDDSGRVPFNRIERVLTAMIASVGGMSVIAMIAVFVAMWAGVDDFTGGVWPAVRVLPFLGLPITLLLMVAFMIVWTLRRRRIQGNGGR